MERKKLDLNDIVDDDHPRVIVSLKSLTKQLRDEATKREKRKDIRLRGRCGSVSVCSPTKVAKGFVEYVDVETDNIFEEIRDYSKVKDSTDLILEHILKIQLLAKDLNASPGYLKLLELLENATKGMRKAEEG